jgi:hypothetical protein
VLIHIIKQYVNKIKEKNYYGISFSSPKIKLLGKR